MNKMRRTTIWASTALAALMVVAGCSSSSKTGGASTTTAKGATGGTTATTATTGGPAPSSVTIAGLNYSAPFAAQYAAMGSTGAFNKVEQEFHTTIKFEQFGTTQNAQDAMLGGSADMSIAALGDWLVIDAAGKPVVATFAPVVGGGGVLVGAKKWEQSRGTDLAKFAGSTFGYTREGSASELYMEIAVNKAGLNWSSLPHVAFGQPAAALPLLQAGRLDVAATDPTTAAQLISSGAAYLILNLNDPKTAYPVIGEQLGTVYAFNKSFVDQYPQLVKALDGALLQGLNAVKAVSSNPSSVLALFPSNIQQALSSGFSEAWPLSAPGVDASDGTMPDSAVQATISFGESVKQLTPAQAAVASNVVNNSY